MTRAFRGLQKREGVPVGDRLLTALDLIPVSYATDNVTEWRSILEIADFVSGGATAAEDVSIEDLGGYFTGTDVEAALQELGAALAGFDPAVAAENVSYDNAVSGLTATDVQAAIDELDATLDGFSPVVAAKDVTFTPTGGIAATDVQAALAELDSEKAGLTALAAAGGAALIGYDAGGGIAGDTVQDAIAELDTEKVAKAGDTMTGALISVAGAEATPGLAVGEVDTGFFLPATNKLGISVDALERMRITDDGITIVIDATAAFDPPASSGLNLRNDNGAVNVLSEATGAGSIFSVDVYRASATSPGFRFQHARGTRGTPAKLNTNDNLATIQPRGHSGAAFVEGGLLEWKFIGADAAVGMQTALIINLCNTTTGRTEVARFDTTSAFQMFGGNIVVDATRHFRARIYTIGTLPTSAVAGELIACSDLGGAAGQLVSTSASAPWQRTTPGWEAIASNADFTLTVLTNAEDVQHTGTLTADRTITLSTTRAYAGASFTIFRSGTGAFNLIVGSLCNLYTGEWCRIVYNGSAWVLEEMGVIGPTSGVYTPTLTNVTNLAASTAYACQWSRQGRVVTVTGKADVDPTAPGSAVLGISLPIASNLAAAAQCAGTAVAPGIAGQSAAILADITNDRANMEWIAVDVTNQAMAFTFSYLLI